MSDELQTKKVTLNIEITVSMDRGYIADAVMNVNGNEIQIDLDDDMDEIADAIMRLTQACDAIENASTAKELTKEIEKKALILLALAEINKIYYGETQ